MSNIHIDPHDAFTSIIQDIKSDAIDKVPGNNELFKSSRDAVSSDPVGSKAHSSTLTKCMKSNHVVNIHPPL